MGHTPPDFQDIEKRTDAEIDNAPPITITDLNMMHKTRKSNDNFGLMEKIMHRSSH